MVYFQPVEALAQSGSDGSDTSNEEDISIVIRALHDKYGLGKIILKGMGIIKNVKVHQIKPYWIVYIKNGSYHDLMIEKIKKIEIGKEQGRNIYFEKNKPVIFYK